MHNRSRPCWHSALVVVLLAALSLAVALVAPASAQPADAAAGDGPAVISINYNLHSVYALPQDPGRFALRGVLTVDYDLEALAPHIDAAPIRYGRYREALATEMIARSGLPEVVVENQSDFSVVSTFLFVDRERTRAILNQDFEVAIRPSAAYWSFPFDRQNILLVFTLLGVHAEDVRLSHGEGAVYSLLADLVVGREDGRMVGVDTLQAENHHHVEGPFLIDRIAIRELVEDIPGVGAYSSLLMEIHTKRSFISFFLISFLPTLLLMGLVCIAPWIDDLKAMDLLRFAATVILAMFATMIASRAKTPAGNFVTLMDVFQVGAVTFVFLVSLAEFLRRQYVAAHHHRGVQALLIATRFGSLAVYLVFWVAIAVAGLGLFGAQTGAVGLARPAIVTRALARPWRTGEQWRRWLRHRLRFNRMMQ